MHLRHEGHAFKRAIHRIVHERHRQDELKRAGRFTYTLADDGMTDAERLACLCEELGEIARLVLVRESLVTDGDAADAVLRDELSQVAALAVAWMERL